ncbi:MAG TPA: ribosome biogenesis GTPase Der [Terriglobales bacterium]|nr:ribosome biogenesis GTPase Der [Terriglobales bacterium]
MSPTIAIVGRPNVGKSTLFNRLIGSRRAIVGDEPGITRDRLYGVAHWLGRDLRIVDTGGIVPEDKEVIPAEIFRQAKVALAEADAIVMVVDGRSELAAPDMELSRLLLKTGKPLFLAVNKIDTLELEPMAESYRTLGIREVFPVSAEHSNGVAELLDEVIRVLPPPDDHELPATVETSASEAGQQVEAEYEPDAAELDLRETPSFEVKVAIIGRPNVGKSTLLNRLTGSARAIVSPIPGTTRDAVDELVRNEDRLYRFIDTAGIRRKGRTEQMAEKLSVVMARKHMEAADVTLLVIDGLEGVTALDANIAGYAHESGRSVIVVVNKWDLVVERARQLKQKEEKSATSARRAANTPRRAAAQDLRIVADQAAYERHVREQLKFLGYAPVVFVSAATGRHTEKLLPLIDEVARERRKRIATGEMNRFLKNVDFERAPVPFSKRVRILYMTQAAVAPPTFVLFTDRDVKLHFSYERYLENQIRRAFGFVGTPIRIKVRPRRGKL